MKVIQELVKKLHTARKKPFSKKSRWLEIQEELIKHITYTEKKITNIKLIIKLLKIELSQKQVINTKEQATNTKNKIDKLYKKLELYRTRHSYLKSIGDGIAFTFINRFDLKPQNFKESPGFIYNKAGSRLERKILRTGFSMKSILILNDLTHCLKYHDITVVKAFDQWVPIEVKKNEHKNKRITRQQEKSSILLNYIFSDTPADLYNRGEQMHRVSHTKRLASNTKQLNHCIESAYTNGFSVKLIEAGLYYLVTRTEIKNVEEILKDLKLKEPYFFFQNQHKEHSQGYTPYCLSFQKAEYLTDYLQGSLIIIQILDIHVIRKTAHKYGYNINPSKNPEFFIKFTHQNDSSLHFEISNHFFFRVFFEFVSPRWVIEESFKIWNYTLDSNS